ncbi:MAG: aldo/keto reductase [Planctomycetes bacterium]|nr:aldo/keto reductase [Planctomycetota bacterium]MCB9824249.1 aldo/keto reductase [Planctomycetota bacterium]MCB9828480.1 aldo/keto reductase [Planctomycetota bacterium]MCB9900247.1 aldo/keto reductase [Planctomycetota bacterium]
MKHFDLAGGGTIPGLGLGTWKSAPGEVGPVIREAIRLGYRHIDCARAYGNEKEIGAAIEGAIHDGDVTRDDLFITSKLWNDSHAKDAVRPALEKTLADLRLDHLDLYLMHWPVSLKPKVGFPRSADDLISEADLPLTETWAAMEACHDAGLSRHLGVSNCNARRIDLLVDAARVPVAVNQVELHPYLAQDGLRAHAAKRGVHLTAYSPLGSPDRPDVMRRAEDPDLLAHPTIAGVAAKHDATPAQVLLAWALARDTSVIPKSTNPGRLAQNLAAADLVLDADDMATIAGMDAGYRFVEGTFWCPPGSPYSVADLWAE